MYIAWIDRDHVLLSPRPSLFLGKTGIEATYMYSYRYGCYSSSIIQMPYIYKLILWRIINLCLKCDEILCSYTVSYQEVNVTCSHCAII